MRIDSLTQLAVVDVSLVNSGHEVSIFYGNASAHQLHGVSLLDGMRIKLADACDTTASGLVTPMLLASGEFQVVVTQSNRHALHLKLCMTEGPSSSTTFFDTGLSFSIACQIDSVSSNGISADHGERIRLHHGYRITLPIGYPIVGHLRVSFLNACSSSAVTSGQGTPIPFGNLSGTTQTSLALSSVHTATAATRLRICVSEFSTGADFVSTRKYM